MTAIEKLKQLLQEKLPHVSCEDDPPTNDGGTYFLDLQFRDQMVVIEWKKTEVLGFRLYLCLQSGVKVLMSFATMNRL